MSHLSLRKKAWVRWRYHHSVVLFFLEIHFLRMIFPAAHGLKDNSWESVAPCLFVWSPVFGEVGFWGHLSLERPLGALGPSQQTSWRGNEQSIWFESLFLRRAEGE